MMEPKNQIAEDDALWDLARKMEIYVKTRWYHLKGSPESFLGTEAVRWMMVETKCPAKTTQDAVKIGTSMIKQGIICHVSLQRPLPFANAPYFYCFTPAYRVHVRIKIDLQSLLRLGGRLRASIEVKDRQVACDDEDIIYPACFVGAHAVQWMVDTAECPVSNSVEAVDLGSYMVAKGLLSYGVNRDGKSSLPFKNDQFFYCFSPKVVPVGLEEGLLGIEARSVEGKEAAEHTPKSSPAETDEFITSRSFPADTHTLKQNTEIGATNASSAEGQRAQEINGSVEHLKDKEAKLLTAQLESKDSELEQMQELVETFAKREEDAFFVVDQLQTENARLHKLCHDLQALHASTQQLLQARAPAAPASPTKA